MLSKEMYFKNRRRALTVLAVFLIGSIVVIGLQAGIEVGVLIPAVVVYVMMLTLGFIIGSYYVLEHIAKRYRYQEKYDCNTLLKELYNIDENCDKKGSNKSSKIVHLKDFKNKRKGA